MNKDLKDLNTLIRMEHSGSSGEVRTLSRVLKTLWMQYMKKLQTQRDREKAAAARAK